MDEAFELGQRVFGGLLTIEDGGLRAPPMPPKSLAPAPAEPGRGSVSPPKSLAPAPAEPDGAR